MKLNKTVIAKFIIVQMHGRPCRETYVKYDTLEQATNAAKGAANRGVSSPLIVYYAHVIVKSQVVAYEYQ